MIPSNLRSDFVQAALAVWPGKVDSLITAFHLPPSQFWCGSVVIVHYRLCWSGAVYYYYYIFYCVNLLQRVYTSTDKNTVITIDQKEICYNWRSASLALNWSTLEQVTTVGHWVDRSRSLYIADGKNEWRYQLLCSVVEASLSDLLDGSWMEYGISCNWCMILNIVIALSLILHWAKDGQFKFSNTVVTLANVNKPCKAS